MSKTRLLSLSILVVGVAIFATLLLADPAWARPSCASCEYNYSNCMAGCSTQQCMNNCEGWYDICWGSCVMGTYGSAGACVANCIPGFTCELKPGTSLWWCVGN
jgi:hypothetical protein